LRGDTSPDAFDDSVFTDGDLIRYSYRLTERRDERVVHALYGFAIGVDSHVQIAIYFDDEADLEMATASCRSLDETDAL
jgi:hypothetical protein